MKKVIITSAAALAVVASANAANIAIGGTQISGGTNGGAETTFANGSANFVDGVITSATGGATAQIDTWASGSAGDDDGNDFVGVTGITLAGGEQITNVTFHGSIFGDGGWFGTNGDTDPANAVNPTVQITTDGGATWTNVAGVTTNYSTVVGAITLPANNQVANRVGYTATFDFAGLTDTNIDGVRLFGASGGNAGADGNGFIVVREFEVNTVAIPEPSSTALLGLGGLALILRRRK